MSYNTYLKQVREDSENVAQLNKKLATNQTLYDNHKKTVTDTYNQQIEDSKDDYENAYRENAVQKKVNEFYIAEEMANMGLTNSGLNRTQITANQLSYANNKANIDRQRQSMVDSLTRELTASLTDIENQRLSSEQTIRDEWDANNQSIAQNLYTAKVNADAEVEKERIKATKNKNELYKLNYGSLASTIYGSNDNVVYTDADGNTATMRAGSNPYTGKINKDALNDDGEYDKSKVFSNGYQPNNYNGTVLSKLKEKDGFAKTTFNASWRTDGVEQSIWKANNKYYVWVGPNNQYVEVEYNKAKNDWVWA